MAEHPSGTVTFMFTDIEGSTGLWEKFPAEMKAALETHDGLLRNTIENNKGYVFKTVGDAFCAAFDTAEDALTAAIEIQSALKNQNWKNCPIKVRIALHSGISEERDGDYFGPTLNRTARIEAAGHGGQVLLSAACHELLKDNLPEKISLKNLGLRRLKDLERAEQIYQADIIGEEAEFPPLKTLDIRPNNLPVQLTSFIGREQEITELKNVLHNTRLLTLLGPGGIGKTRIAQQIAADLLDAFEHGVWFIDLSNVTDADGVVKTCASVLDVAEERDHSLLRMLINRLREQKMLLILDNCEQAIDACADFTDKLLSQCPAVKIIATSREVLQLPGEATYQLPPMGVPQDIGGRKQTIENLNQYLSVKLFIDRARLVRPDFVVTNETAPALAQICCLLDGIPLAIELAASRTRMFSLEELLSRLEDSLSVLSRKSRNIPARQKTLSALIDWSYRLLDEEEKQFFAGLSVFSSGFTLHAAEAVCGSKDPIPVENAPRWRTLYDPDSKESFPECASKFKADFWSSPGLSQHIDVLETLESLVDKSLLQTEEKKGQTRYKMLWTIRRYAESRLEELNETEIMKQRLLSYYCLMSEEAEYYLTAGNDPQWLFWLDGEYGNIKTVLLSAQNMKSQFFESLRLRGVLMFYWVLRGHIDDYRKWCIKHHEIRGIKNGELYQAYFLHKILKYSFSDTDIEKDFFLSVLERCEERGFRGAAAMIRSLNLRVLDFPDIEKHIAEKKSLLAVIRELGLELTELEMYNEIGFLYGILQDREAAIAAFQKAIDIGKTFALPMLRKNPVSSLSALLLFDDKAESAEAILSDFLTESESFSVNPLLYHTMVVVYIAVLILLNKVDEAQILIKDLEQRAVEMEDERMIALTKYSYGCLFMQKGETKEAFRYLYAASIDPASRKSKSQLFARILLNLSHVLYLLDMKTEFLVLAGFLLMNKQKFEILAHKSDLESLDANIEAIRKSFDHRHFSIHLDRGKQFSEDEVVSFIKETLSSCVDQL